MNLIRFLLQRSPGLFALAVVVGGISGLANSGLLMLINSAIHGTTLPIAADPRWLFAVLCLALPATQVVSWHLLVKLAEGGVREMRLNLSRRILKSPLRRLEEHGAHRLLVALTHDIDMVSRSNSLLPLLFINATMILGCLVYLIWLAPKLLVVLLVAVVGSSACYQLFLVGANRQLRRAREQYDRLYNYLQGVTEGIKELKLHQLRQQAFLTLLDETNDRLRAANVSARTTFAVGRALGLLVFFSAIGYLVFGLTDAADVSREAVTGYALVLLFLVGPLQTILTVIPEFGRARIALEKIHDLGLSLEPEHGEELAETPVAPSWSRLELAGISYVHHSEKRQRPFRLGPIELTLKPGELVFLIGGNGSGKTTLVKLLMGLYAPEEGTIRLDGQALESGLDFESYRQNFATVFADFYLFESLLGLERSDLDRDAGRYLEELQLAGEVEIEDGAFSTLSLSSGQRKRLALLTAYLEDRPIYVFDEWAAEQDPVFREIFYREMLPELRSRGKLVLVISHDDRYYGVADRIVKLDYGQIVYDGRAADLPGPVLP